MIFYLGKPFLRVVFFGATILALLAPSVFAGDDDNEGQDQAVYVSRGQRITPTAAPRAVLQLLNPGPANFPDFVSSGGVSSVVSPDQKTLLVLTSGHNQLNDKNGAKVSADSEEYVFVYDISAGTAVRQQVLKVPNTFVGIAFNPNGQAFYVGGGKTTISTPSRGKGMEAGPKPERRSRSVIRTASGLFQITRSRSPADWPSPRTGTRWIMLTSSLLSAATYNRD